MNSNDFLLLATLENGMRSSENWRSLGTSVWQSNPAQGRPQEILIRRNQKSPSSQPSSWCALPPTRPSWSPSRPWKLTPVGLSTSARAPPPRSWPPPTPPPPRTPRRPGSPPPGVPRDTDLLPTTVWSCVWSVATEPQVRFTSNFKPDQKPFLTVKLLCHSTNKCQDFGRDIFSHDLDVIIMSTSLCPARPHHIEPHSIGTVLMIQCEGWNCFNLSRSEGCDNW